MARLELTIASKFSLRIFDIEGTRCSENESRCNKWARVLTSDVQFESLTVKIESTRCSKYDPRYIGLA